MMRLSPRKYGGAIAPSACDPYFAYVAVLLHLDDTGLTNASGASELLTNHGYSTNDFYRYANGYVFQNGDTFFDVYTGVGDYTVNEDFYNNRGMLKTIRKEFQIAGGVNSDTLLTIPASNEVCIEFRINFKALSIYGQNRFCSTGIYELQVDSTTSYIQVFDDASSTWINTTTPTVMPFGTMAHMAMTKELRAGNWYRCVWLEGVKIHEELFSDYALTAYFYIYGSIGNGDSYEGAGDEIRVTIGEARYRSTFAPPTEPFPEVACAPTTPSYVIALLNFNSGLLDEKGNTWSYLGDAYVASGQLELDGTGDGIKMPPLFFYDGSDWTIDFYITPDASDDTYFMFSDEFIQCYVVGGLFFLNVGDGGGLEITNGADVPTAGVKTHVAITWRDPDGFGSGSAIGEASVFFNGVLKYFIPTAGAGHPAVSAYDFHVGVDSFDSATWSLLGNISSFRITKGLARYFITSAQHTLDPNSANFTPPTEPLTGT